MSAKLAALCLLQAIAVKAIFPPGIIHPAGPVAVRQAAPPGCTNAANLITACEDAISGFDNLPGNEQALCICYDGTTWDPSYFDDAVAQCASYAQTADPTDYSSIASLEGFCTKEGPVAPTTATTTPKPVSTAAPVTTHTVVATTATATSAGAAGITACSSVDAAISSCEAATAGFISLDGSVQASCICYNGNSWDPSQFDGQVLSCANYLSTANPTDYSDIVSLESFCTSQGNVRSSNAESSTTVRSQVVVTNSPPTASIGAGSTSSPSTTKTSTVAPVVVTVVASSSVATTSTSKSAGVASFSHDGSMIYLGITFAFTILGLCIVL
jgi:ribosomal protein S18